MMKHWILFLTCLFGFQVVSAQQGSNRLELKDIVEGKYSSSGIGEIKPLPDGESYSMMSRDRKAILKYAYRTGQVTDTLFHVKTAKDCNLENIEGYLINNTGTHIVVWTGKEYNFRRSWKASLYDYDVRRNLIKPLSDSGGKTLIPTFSPDGRMCAYVKEDNNIWLKKFDYDTESQVTQDGAPGKILNGITDWVYEEEFGVTNLMSWSPDSKILAFVRFDESNVPSFSFQHYDGSLYPGSETFKYPKAGENNSVVSCHTYNVETKDIKKMNVPLEENGYIPQIRFTENPEQLAIMTLNRQQNVFNMYYANPKSTVSRLILRDENKYYVSSDFIQKVIFTKDNFVYISEKDGFAHIYLYSTTGILEKQVTAGPWDVTDFYGIDPLTKTIYFQSAEESPFRRSVYSIDSKGKKIKLSTNAGTNNAEFSANFNYFVNRFSNLTTPSLIAIHDAKGKELQVLNNNSALKQTLERIRLPQKEFFTFTTPQGISLNGWMIKPSDFSASRKYPVLMVQYSGPNSQQVLDRFGIGWEEYLAEQGFIVACVDGRGTGARGEEFRKCTYMNLGILESDDQINTSHYLAGLSFVDGKNIGIWGWSYGGTITLMSMSRGNGAFKAGVSIAPVTSWKLYDSVYTERFMRTPKENFQAYDQNSPIALAGNLQGQLLLIHGTSDDNVHFQNSMYYATALVEAGKQFEMQIYPNKNHSILGTKYRMHLYTRVTQFLKNNLQETN